MSGIALPDRGIGRARGLHGCSCLIHCGADGCTGQRQTKETTK